ncbi:MAG: membrane protein insertase YidC [Gammaproteobacteria bacterium]|nr:membrane protein insertase YidC [Gammaproteobacteria bacterium]
MEQVRALLVIGLAILSLLIWQAWRQDYGPKPQPAPTASTDGVEAPVPAAPRSDDVPDASAVPAESERAGSEPAGDDAKPAAAASPVVNIRTDVYDADITLKGGSLSRVDLLQYPVATDKPDEPFRLFSATPPNILIGQSGLVGQTSAPSHHEDFVAEKASYRLAEGQDALVVPLRWTGPDGVMVVKRYTFRRGSYEIKVSFEVQNRSAQPWAGRMYGQFRRAFQEESRGIFRTYTYTGGILSTPEKPYEKIDFSDMAKSDLNLTVEGGWIAMIQHYFAGAWVPDQGGTTHYYTKALKNGRFVIGLLTGEESIPVGGSGQFELGLYVGPKIQELMQDVAPNLERTVDYGWLWLIAEPLFWLLQWIHGFVGNWGWSIIILTIIIKLAFFHLSATSYKSMARMRKVQPRIIAIRERYSSDKQRMNQAMMELYKKEKINPLGGCFPILVQIPVFIALYWVLLESVELRQAPFTLWLDDLSVHDPYFVLPVLMGATMFVQQKLNPAPPDPMQAKIMMALPFVFTFFFLFFPSGLVLYWFVNNLLSIAQQWVITKKIVGKD